MPELHVPETDPFLAELRPAREEGLYGPAFDELYDYAHGLHDQLLELREAYDRCRRNKGALSLLRQKAAAERQEAREALDSAHEEIEALKRALEAARAEGSQPASKD